MTPERRKPSKRGAERVDADAEGRLPRPERDRAADRIERVGEVHDVDVVTASGERGREPIDEDASPPKLCAP